MMVSFLSGPSLLGLSGESYVLGIEFHICHLCMLFAAIIVGQIYLPVFYKLNTVSMFEVSFFILIKNHIFKIQ